MTTRLSLSAVGHATSALLAVSFVLCVAFDLLFPGAAMYRSWEALLPGFTFISWPGFFLGLVESYGYGWYAALVWVPVYNAVRRRDGGSTGAAATAGPGGR